MRDVDLDPDVGVGRRRRAAALRRVSVSETSSNRSWRVSPCRREAVARSDMRRRRRCALPRMPASRSSRSADRHLVPGPAKRTRSAVDHGRGRAKLVGGDGEQVGLLGDGVPALLLVLPLLGLVASDLGEPDVTTSVVVHGADHHARPEPAPVLAHAPPVLGELAFAEGHLEVALGVVGRLLLGRIEDPERSTDDLARAVPLDPLGPGVPADHVAVHVEHEDGVLANGPDQQPEGRLAASQVVLGRALGSDVLDLREHVENLSLRVADGGESDSNGPGGSLTEEGGKLVLEGGQALPRRK